MARSLRELEKKKEEEGLTRREAARLRGLKGSKRKTEKRKERQERAEKAKKAKEKRREAKRRAVRERRVTRIANEYDIPREEARDEIKTEERNKNLQESIETNPDKEYLKNIPQKTTIFG